MANYYSPFSLRVSEEIIEKMKRIAAANHRSANKEMEVALERYIAAYERENGMIAIKKEEP
ncbi:MAG: Arc family DNA-binding protein [Oscillospiraceae bacterium]|nr:Arc family DNA-binding protein [Oscillospiraceae bacterium]